MPSRPRSDEARTFAVALHELLRRYQFQDVNRTCEFDLTLTECHALEVVVLAGPLSVNAAAARLRLNKSTASRALAALETKQLVRRTADDEDRRVVTFEATAEGRRRSSAILAASAERVASLLHGFSDREREAALEILRRLSTSC
jgi:MarR family transcriptional regulator, 2-MHQ and catechol-resistance regulon repressor